jgi:hypothetical protein
MKNFIIANKFKFATVILAAILIYACNLPVTQEKTVGHVLSWTVDGNNLEAVEKIEKLSWLNKNHLKKEITVKDNINKFTYDLILPNTSEEQVKSYRNELESIKDVESVNILPLQESFTRPVYSEMLHSVFKIDFKIDIDATNKSDKDVVNEITKQLEDAGLKNVDVKYERQPEGYRKLSILIPESESNLKNNKIDMKITDGNDEEHLKTENRIKLNCDENRFKGKGDKEIKQIIMEDLKDMNISEDDIQLIRDGDKIKVKVSKKTKTKNGSEKIKKEIELEEIEE